jgi:hypothetical protein
MNEIEMEYFKEDLLKFIEIIPVDKKKAFKQILQNFTITECPFLIDCDNCKFERYVNDGSVLDCSWECTDKIPHYWTMAEWYKLKAGMFEKEQMQKIVREVKKEMDL